MRRLTLTDAELAVTAEAIREALAAELLTPSSRDSARERRITVQSGGGNNVQVRTYNAAGDAAEAPFHLIVAC